MSLPLFSKLTGEVLVSTLLTSTSFWLVASIVFCIGSLLSGLYPAFILSAFRPITALKKAISSTGASGSANLRRGLVIFQFAASIALIAGTLALYRQIEYMRNQDLGVDIEQKLVLRDFSSQDSTFAERIETFKTALITNPEIQGFTASTDIPGKEVGSSSNLRRVNKDSKGTKRCRMFGIDTEFIEHYDLEVVAGRAFSEDFKADQNSAILNETAVSVLGFESPEQAINQEIANNSGEVKLRIIGVLKDYHQESLKFNFKPIVYRNREAGWNYYTLQVKTSEVPELLSFVEMQWKSHFPNSPLQHFFLDSFFDQQYEADKRFGWVVTFFSLLAIIVACLGLFGLSSFNVSRRTKEIGIRKILGAGLGQIILLISKDFIRLILISSIIAIPIIYFLIQSWLVHYAYQVALSWWFFLLPVGFIFLAAWFTIGFQAIKAALANPIESLRYE